MGKREMDFRLEAFFLHKRGLLTILSAENRERVQAASARAQAIPMGDRLIDAVFSEAAVEAIAASDAKPLRELLLHGEAREGALTWEECDFYFMSGKAFRRFEQGDRSARALFQTNLREFNLSARGTFSPEHVIEAASAPGHLSGHRA